MAIAAGGDLSPERLLYAYRHGIFPVPRGSSAALVVVDWRCGSGRATSTCLADCVVRCEDRTAEVRFNSKPRHRCLRRAPRETQTGTCITPNMVAAYERLHREGWAHSVEVWQGESLLGGVYGLIIGRAFSANQCSVLSRRCKMALFAVSRMMDSNKLGVLDCQIVSSHLLSLGAAARTSSEACWIVFAVPPSGFRTGLVRRYQCRSRRHDAAGRIAIARTFLHNSPAF